MMMVHKLDLEMNMYGQWKKESLFIPFLSVNIPVIVNAYSRIIEEYDAFMILNLGRLFVYI
jgi:hypothetical protein